MGLVGDGHPQGINYGGLCGILVTIHLAFGFLKIEFIGIDRSVVITWHSDTKLSETGLMLDNIS
jgi:hypothetical protein